MSVNARLDARALKVCLASHHNVQPAAYKGLTYEACEALAAISKAKVIAPPGLPEKFVRTGASKIAQRLTGRHRPMMQPHRVTEQFDLFLYVCSVTSEIVQLERIEGWRERSRKAAVFVFESWTASADEERHYYRLFDQFDHVFLFNPSSVPAVQQRTSARCSYMPAGIDCLLATPVPHLRSRPIDVYGMGRVDQAVHNQFVDLTLADQLLYLWDTVPSRVPVGGYLQARQRTYHAIRNSKFFLSFNFSIPSEKSRLEARGEEAIPARVFEGAAAGAVLLGSKPPLAEYDDLFDWPDALIEVPPDPADLKEFMSELERQTERIRHAGMTNALECLRRHDWVYRWEEMLRVLELPVPPGAAERKAQLAALANAGEGKIGPSLAAVG